MYGENISSAAKAAAVTAPTSAATIALPAVEQIKNHSQVRKHSFSVRRSGMAPSISDLTCGLTEQANRRLTRGRKPAGGRPVERRVRPHFSTTPGADRQSRKHRQAVRTRRTI